MLGRVEAAPSGLPWRVIFPDGEHLGATSYLRELAASDCSPLTVRSYAFDLLRWFRFLHESLIGCERAERVEVRAFVEWLSETPNPSACAGTQLDLRLARAMRDRQDRAAGDVRGTNHQPLVTRNLAAVEIISLR